MLATASFPAASDCYIRRSRQSTTHGLNRLEAARRSGIEVAVIVLILRFMSSSFAAVVATPAGPSRNSAQRLTPLHLLISRIASTLSMQTVAKSGALLILATEVGGCPTGPSLAWLTVLGRFFRSSETLVGTAAERSESSGAFASSLASVLSDEIECYE